MKVHPEMKKIIDEEMKEGLQYWRNRSPEDILKRIKARMIVEQKSLLTPASGIAWRWERVGCDCGANYICFPWCNGRKEIVFFTPAEDMPAATKITFGHGAFGVFRKDDK